MKGGLEPPFFSPVTSLIRPSARPSLFRSGRLGGIILQIDHRVHILSPLYVVCVARHEYIAKHIARFFESVEVSTVGVVGVQGAVDATRSCAPDVVVCEYELLTTHPLEDWECDEVLRYAPIVAVSLTRRSNELVPLDCNGIAGFLYLPTLLADDAHKLLRAAASRPRYTPGGANFSTIASRPQLPDAPR